MENNMNMLYIDPATTAVVASLAAVFTALGAAFIIIWRKVKKGVSKTFHIDENANREVEEELVILDDAASPEAEAAKAEDKAEESDTVTK